MSTIKEGDKVQLICEAKLETGELCYKNDKDNLIEIIVGEGKFFPPIEKALQEIDRKMPLIYQVETYGENETSECGKQ